jgi:hypothetical protein
LLLIGATLACWLLIGLPARWAWGDAALVHCGVAALLCLVPAAATLAWAGWAYGHSPDQQLTTVLGGTGLRLFGVGAGAYALNQSVPYFRADVGPGFLTWVLVFYLITLALETTLLLAGRPASEDAVSAGPTTGAGRIG